MFVNVKYYFTDFFSLQPRNRVPLFRSDIKERCAAIVQISFLSIGTVSTIAQVVTRQLSAYNYTFPSSLHVSLLFFSSYNSWFILV